MEVTNVGKWTCIKSAATSNVADAYYTCPGKSFSSGDRVIVEIRGVYEDGNAIPLFLPITNVMIL